MIKLATPISHLFKDINYANVIISNSDCLECRDRTIDNNSPKQELFHCELQPIHLWGDKEFSYLQKIKDTKKDLKLITFHMASSCDNPIIKNSMFEVGGYEYTDIEMLENAQSNFKKIKTIFTSDIQVAVENNNYYPTDAYKYITDAEFISKVVHQNKINFLFDIAHAKVTCYNKNINFDVYKSKLPLDKIIQLHICSPSVNNKTNMAFDAHHYPNEEELLNVKELIKLYSKIKYLTVEYYKDIENLEKSLIKVKNIVYNYQAC